MVETKPDKDRKRPAIDNDSRLAGGALRALRQRGLSDEEIRKALNSLTPIPSSLPPGDDD